MRRLREMQAELLRDGKITDQEVAVLRGYIEEKGNLDTEDMRFLVELLVNAREVAPAFDDIFFPALKKTVLADGRIGLDEQFYLLKMLYSDGVVRDREKQFLEELRREANETTPEFEALCEEALHCSATNWSVGGR